MLASLALLLASGTSLAGGFGLIGTGGLHGDRVYYYQENSIGEAEQMPPMDQLNPNVGGGVELIIGDKDYKVNGLFRFYYLVDGPEQAPGSADDFTFNIRTTPREIGVMDVGLQFGVLGEADGLQLVVMGILGTGVMTRDTTEFLQAQAGIGGTYTIARRWQAHVEVDGGIRYRKRFYPTVNGTAGLRYLFD